VVVERRGPRGTVLIPALGLEVFLPLHEEITLDTRLSLVLSGVKLPELDAYFRVED
jgi:hypothetical protein